MTSTASTVRSLEAWGITTAACATIAFRDFSALNALSRSLCGKNGPTAIKPAKVSVEMTIPDRITQQLAHDVRALDLVASEALEMARQARTDAELYKMMLSETLSLLHAQHVETQATRRQLTAIKDELARYLREQVLQ